jgi:cytochrome d ubiquinol oxidase subunit I
MILMFATAFVLVTLRRHDTKWFLVIAVAALPLPWISTELGWVLAEMGRQPWAVDGVLPTFYAASGLALHEILTTLAVFTLTYTVLLIIEVKLMLKTIRTGPADILPSLQPSRTPLPHHAATPAPGQA